MGTGTIFDSRLHDTASAIVYASQKGLASFPLSDTHYIETLRRGDPRSRQDLGSAMHQISRSHRIASLVDLFQPEVEYAFSVHFGFKPLPKPYPFGIGMKFAFGRPDESYFSSAEAEARAVAKHGREVVDDVFEAGLIMGPDYKIPSGGIGRPGLSWSQKQLDGEREITRRITDHGHSPDLARRVILHEESVHFIDPVVKLALQNGMPTTGLFESREEMEAFLFAMPSKGVLTRMRMSAHENANFKWEIGDLGDLAALSVAAAYCDIVVCEKKWGSILNRHASNLNATVITDLRDLLPLLL